VAWRGSHRGGVDSVGLVVELTAWVSRWRDDGVGLAMEGAMVWISRWRG
jgi:hypothetical protein